jgi:hypothetical protein
MLRWCLLKELEMRPLQYLLQSLHPLRPRLPLPEAASAS